MCDRLAVNPFAFLFVVVELSAFVEPPKVRLERVEGRDASGDDEVLLCGLQGPA